MGRKLYFDDDQQTPDTMHITYNYDNQAIHFEQRLWCGYREQGSENSVAGIRTPLIRPWARSVANFHRIAMTPGSLQDSAVSRYPVGSSQP